MKQLALYFALFVPFGLWGKPQLEEIIGVSRGLHSPFGVTFDNQGNSYIAEYLGGRILKLDTAGKLHTLSGNKQKGYAGDGMQAKQGFLIACTMWCGPPIKYSIFPIPTIT